MNFMGLFRNERGGILVYVVAAIIPFTAILGLVVDYGEAATCANKMQRAVDAAALAGATKVYTGSVQATALDLADANYQIYDNCNVSVTGDRVTVRMQRDVPTHFMRIFGIDIVDVGVKASAIRGRPLGEVTGHLMPFCIINPDTNDDPADDLILANYGKEYILAFGEDNVSVQDWANGDTPPPAHPGSADGNGEGDDKTNSMGWRCLLALNDDGTMGSGGASDFRYNFINGWSGSAAIDDVLPTKMGNMSGPIDQGREDRLEGEEDLLFEEFDPQHDFNMGRVVLVPVVSLLVDNSETERFTFDMYNNGDTWAHHEVILDGFAPFWLLTAEEMGDMDGNGTLNNDGDWIIGKFIPGTRIPGGIGGGDDYGAITPPKLID